MNKRKGQKIDILDTIVDLWIAMNLMFNKTFLAHNSALILDL